PRRVVDLEDSFYIVAWAYYCRQGCQAHFHGWSQRLLNSLPPYVRLAFPAVLSHKISLSCNVVSTLRVGNQHKMGPSGVRSLLFEMHTHRFNVIQLQYLESIFERLQTRESANADLRNYFDASMKVPSIGNFSDVDGYSGFIPGERYLAAMLNKAIERDEADANQHTSLLEPDQLAIDDSHKHIAKVEGVNVFGAMWTCMTSRYIRSQALTLTKAHEERIGPLTGISQSAKRYGHNNPCIIFSDDPIKDKHLINSAFPMLSKNLTPIAEAHGLIPFELPSTLSPVILTTAMLIESTLSSLMAPLDIDKDASLCISFDAEWNVSRTLGVSIIQLAPHQDPPEIFLIPIYRFDRKLLPPSLLRLMLSNRVFKIGSGIKGDMTWLKKQFSQLSGKPITTIDLKDYAIQRGVIHRKDSGSLDALVEKTLEKYLLKEDVVRKSERWEDGKLSSDLIQYAATDVFASHCIFEKLSESPLLNNVSIDTPAGSRIALLIQEGGEIIAYGKISADQSSPFKGVRVKVPNRNRVVIDIDTLLKPSAVAVLHIDHSISNSTASKNGRTKLGAFTLGQLQEASMSSSFSIVTPTSLLIFDNRNLVCYSDIIFFLSLLIEHQRDIEALESSVDTQEPMPFMEPLLPPDTEPGLESDSEESDDQSYPQRLQEDFTGESSTLAAQMLQANYEASASPPDSQSTYQTIKKDIFHAFQMIPTPRHHGARPEYLHEMRDHLLRWDPVIREKVDCVCRKFFNLTFDEMLARNPRFIEERTPRHVPPPSVLVPSLLHVFQTFGKAIDAKTGAPLFSKKSWAKAYAVLDLACEGYLSDNLGIVLYEKAGTDQYGLQKWRCTRGTNKVEGGPHGDIYRKFGALHAGPRLTVNCLTDHRTCVDWNYHHDLGLINRTSFLLNYLSDTVKGASSYSDWINGDLYERTAEQFGVCLFPESLRTRFGMASYNDEASKAYKLNASNNWLRQRQGLALPVLPPTTQEARRYFFAQIRIFSVKASADGKGRVDYEAFAREWNRTADGTERVYVSPEVLAAYSKSWEKANNIRATVDLMSDGLEEVRHSGEVFAAANLPFPDYLTGDASFTHPSQGVVEIDSEQSLPLNLSISMAPAASHSSRFTDTLICAHPTSSGPPQSPQSPAPISATFDELPTSPPPPIPVSRTEPAQNQPLGEPQLDSLSIVVRNGIPTEERKRRKIRSCRRCRNETCPGGNDILRCQTACTVPCRWCGRLDECRGVDGGKKCTAPRA
ncbi:hypothetical protein EDD85DRAFT_970646, partial [Armillaria nabsnona]